MKTTIIKSISPRQLKALQAAIRGIGIDDRQERLEWLSARVGRRVGSTKELTFGEAGELLSRLNGEPDDRARPMPGEEARMLVGTIYKLSFSISFLNKDYSGSDTPEDFEMNKAKINAWVRKYSGTGKCITQMKPDELRKVHRAMQKIVRKEEEDKEARP